MSKDRADSKPRISFKALQNQLEDFKQKRDDLNKKTKEYIKSLQDIDMKINKCLKTARDVYKKKRDHWNRKVKKLKAKKIEYKNLLDSIIEEKKKLQKSKSKKKGHNIYSSIKQIERKIDNLERIIEIENLEISEENAIIDKIRELATNKLELLQEQQNDELYKIERKTEIVKINLNKIYEQLNKWSEKSQTNHQAMLDLYQTVNELRDRKKKEEESLIENKKKADIFHEKYLGLMNQRKKRNNNRAKRPYNNRNRNKPRYNGNFKKQNQNQELLNKMKQDKLAVALEKQKSGKKLNLFEARLILEQSK